MWLACGMAVGRAAARRHQAAKAAVAPGSSLVYGLTHRPATGSVSLFGGTVAAQARLCKRRKQREGSEKGER